MFYIFVQDVENQVELWKINPTSRQEFAVQTYPKSEIFFTAKEQDARQILDLVSRQNPGKKVSLCYLSLVGQIPLSKEEVSLTTITEKGMLPL